MEWNNEEENPKKGMKMSSIILLAIIVCVIIIIILMSILLLNAQQTTFSIILDNNSVNVTKEALLTTIDNTTYVNIEEFAKLVGYEYHKGEYKTFTIEEGKCYVQGIDETATFYQDDKKVRKLPINELTEDYQQYSIEKAIKNVNGIMYAPVEAIKLAFNVVIDETENVFNIYTLDNLVAIYDARVQEWGYVGISDQNFENKKSLLYGYLIVNKESGLYKIIDTQNKNEIVSDRYSSIQFAENTKEFFVTNSLGQVGIINLDGSTKIEPVYNSISILDKESDLYLVQKDDKYGVVKSGNITIIYPEYTAIGINNQNTNINLENQYLLLDKLIPVCQNNKWGAYDKEGKLILNVEYDELGCNVTTIDVNGTKKVAKPVLVIEQCNGIVVKKDNKYGLIDIKGKELVPVAVECIYEVENPVNENAKYFMLYQNEELNIIERLINAGLIEQNDTQSNNETENQNNNIATNLVDTNSTNSLTNQTGTDTNTISNN